MSIAYRFIKFTALNLSDFFDTAKILFNTLLFKFLQGEFHKFAVLLFIGKKREK